MLTLLLVQCVSSIRIARLRFVRRASLCQMVAESPTKSSVVTPVGRLAAFVLDCIPAVLVLDRHSKRDSIWLELWRENSSSTDVFASLAEDHLLLLKYPPQFLNESEFLENLNNSSSHVMWIGDQRVVDEMTSRYLPEVKTGKMRLLVDEQMMKFYFEYPPELLGTIEECNGRPLDQVVLTTSWIDEADEAQQHNVETYLQALFPRRSEAFVDLDPDHPAVKVLSNTN